MQKSEVAILVIDMQNDFVLPGAVLNVAGAQATIPAIQELICCTCIQHGSGTAFHHRTRCPSEHPGVRWKSWIGMERL